MINKKRVMILIHLSFIATYILSMLFIFKAVENDQFNKMHRFSSDLVHNLGYEGISSAQYMMDFNSSFVEYPAVAVLYNRDGNVALKSGSYITFFTEDDEDPQRNTIFIDEYLTDDIKKQIIDLSKENNSDSYYFTVNKFCYTQVGGELIPVSMEITDSNMLYESITLNFTDYDHYETVTEGITLSLVDIDESTYEHRIYKKLDEMTSFNTEKVYQLFMSNGGSAYYGPESALSTHHVQFSDGEFVLCTATYMQPVIETLMNYAFKEFAVSLLIIFAIIYLIVILLFNKIIKQAKRLEENKIAFTSAAAHELKTPLSIIENQCECILENVAPEKNLEYVNSIYSESLRMNKLVAILLQYNRLVSEDSVKKEECNLTEIVNVEIDKYLPLADAKNIELQRPALNKAADIICNKNLIALVVDNYISNAIKHTENGKTVKIYIFEEGKGFKLSVFNEGKCIESEYKDKLWELFYRNDKARSRDDGSTGMGLAICRQILEQHNFKYGFVNRHNGVEFYFIT